MTTKEAEVFHKLRVATPLSTRSGHPVSVVFNGISANAWLSPIGISHGKKKKDARDERYIAQRPHTAGSIAIVRHHPKPSGLQRSEILTGRQLPVNSNKSNCCQGDKTGFRRPMAFEDGYTSPIGSHMYNQKVFKKGYRGGGFCDGPQTRPRPYTSIPQMRITKETPITLELTVKSLELNRGSSGNGSCHVLYDDDRSQQQQRNVNAYDDLRKTCIQRAKSAPAGSRPSGGSKSPSLYWRARSAYHRKLMTSTPDPEVDEGEDTQVVRGSMLRPLMYSSNTDIQHSAGCPYQCKGCFKACLVSQDYLEKSKRRRLPVRVRRDLRQRSMMKKDPRYILHQALARNQPIYKLVHGLCDERTVREAWDERGTIRGHREDSASPSDHCSVAGEPDACNTVDETEVVQCETNYHDASTEIAGSVDEVSLVVTETQNVKKTDTIEDVSKLLTDRKNAVGINRRVKSAELRKLERMVELKDRPKSCSPGQRKDHHNQFKFSESEFSKCFKRDETTVSVSQEKKELKRGDALDLSDSGTDRGNEDSTEDRRGSTSTVSQAAPFSEDDNTETECVSLSMHHTHVQSRRDRQGKKLRKASRQEPSAEDDSCSASEEEWSVASDSTVENKRRKRMGKYEGRRQRKHSEDSDSYSGSSGTLTEQSASENSETSVNGGYSSSEQDHRDVISDYKSEYSDSDGSELKFSKRETQKRNVTKTKRKTYKRSEKHIAATPDDKTVEELSVEGMRTPGTVDYAANEIHSATESELQFDTASRDSGSVRDSCRSSNSGRSTVKDSVLLNSDRPSTKGSNRSHVRSSNSIIYSNDCSRRTASECSSVNSSYKDTVNSKIGRNDRSGISERSSVNSRSSNDTINKKVQSTGRSSINISNRSKDKKFVRSRGKVSKQKPKASDSSSVNSDSDGDSSEEESSNSSPHSDSSEEEGIEKSPSKKKMKKHTLIKSKIGRNRKEQAVKSKKKDLNDKVKEEEDSSDNGMNQTDLVTEGETTESDEKSENNYSDDVKSKIISKDLSGDNQGNKKQSFQCKRTKTDSEKQTKEKGSRVKAKRKCDDDENTDDKSSGEDTSEEDGKDQRESDDDEDKEEGDVDSNGDEHSCNDEHEDKNNFKTQDKDIKKVNKSSRSGKPKLLKSSKSGELKNRANKQRKGNGHRKRECADSYSDDDTDCVDSESDDTNKQASEASERDTDNECKERNQTKSKESICKSENKTDCSDEQTRKCDADEEDSDNSDSDGCASSDKDRDSDTGNQSSSDTDDESEESDESDDEDLDDDSD